MAEGRQELEADLRREDRLRVMGRVVAGIAHEIRNPLNSIRLTIRVLARKLESEPASQEPIALVTGEVDRLDALLRSLLVFRSDAAEKMRQQPIQPILDRTVALVKPHAEEHGVRIQAARCEEALVFVDGDYLQQALMNLMLNAIDASTREGVVVVSITKDSGQLRLEIEDSGPGLTPEQEERLFEAFYTTKPGGTGLGLAVTRTLLEKMGARIEAVRGSRGALFRVTLPMERPA
jgi:signal transduction histidine kinase